MSEEVIVEDPLLRYEKAKRAGQVEKFKVSTAYGKFFFWVGTQQAKQEILTNMTDTYYDGPWLRQIPVEIRNRMKKMRWADIGSNTGWFAFKSVHGMMPRTIFCLEPSLPRFGFLRHNQMMHDRNSAIGLMFKHVIPTKEHAVSTAEITLDSTTGLASLSGTVPVTVPVIGFDDLFTKHNLNALRFNIRGYEKDILLNSDLKRVNLLLAHINKADYTDKEYAKVKKILKKAYKNVHIHKTGTKGLFYYICYNENMVM